MDILFTEEYENNLMLIEVPQVIVDSIKRGDEIIMKGGDQTILCTREKSYELKYLETSNTFMLIDDPAQNDTNLNKKEISLMVNHTLECHDYTPKKYTVINILREECSLTYDRETGEDNFDKFNNKYTIDKLFLISELCSNDFSKMLYDYGVFEKKGYACVFDEVFMYSILFEILTKVSNEEIDYKSASLDEVFELIRNPNNEKVLDKLSIIEKQSIMRTTFDPINEEDQMISNNFTLNVEKVKMYCAKNVFLETQGENFKLEEFIVLLRKLLILSLPSQLYDKLTLDNSEYLETGAENNLFEYFKDFDLRFLKGSCVVYFLKTQRDPLIKIVNFTYLSEKFRERLNDLFKIKEKWTLREIITFLNDLHISSIEEKLANFSRIIPEVNPFDKNKLVNFYQLKYKLY